MNWHIDFFDGSHTDEKKVNYASIDRKKIKQIYLKDINNNVFGIDVEKKHIFINNNIFDIKVTGEIIDVIQYKEASFNLNLHTTVIRSWNLGVIVQNNDLVEKYILSINFNGLIYLFANKMKDNFIIDEKTIQLK